MELSFFCFKIIINCVIIVYVTYKVNWRDKLMQNKISKMFIIPGIIIIFLLVVQALCDLELPEYTSKIINNGIQSKGITSSVPEVIPEDIFNAIVKVSDEDIGILASYDLVVRDNLSKTELKKYVKKYPILEKENVYLLKDLDEQQLEKLQEKLTKPLVLVTMLRTNNEAIVNFLGVKLEENQNLLDMLFNLDEDKYNLAITSATEVLDGFDSFMLEEYGKLSVQEVYKLSGIDMDKYQINYIIGEGLMMLGVAGIGMVVAIMVGYLTSRLASTLGYYLRTKIVNKILAFSAAEFKDFGASSLITRSTNDIEQIKMFTIMLLRIVILAPIMGIGAFVKVSNNPLNWLIGVALVAILILISILFGLAMPKFKSMQKLIDKMNLVSREIVTGMPVIRTFHTEKYEEERFDGANNKLTRTNLFINRLMNIMMPSMMLVMNIVSILIVWYGAKQIDLGTLQIGTLLAFITYTMQIIMSFLMISLVSVMLPRALVSIKRIREIFKKEITIQEVQTLKKFNKDAKGTVEFKNVSFKYPDADEAMLKNISFKAEKGTTTAFIGSTGSGKSTLINLIPRFFDVTEGEILVDGVNIKEVRLKDLRDRIGYVPQKGMLLSGTIESNLKLGNDKLTKEEMEKCAQVSQAEEFILEKDKKYKSEIAQGGTNVSGGQKQRLSIARAMAKNPEIYIFDDSFSALDFKTDAKLRKELKNYAKEATILIVAQRISTIMNADNIVVLNEGEIVGAGTHKELLKNCPIYKEIALSQLKEEEL